MESNNLVVVCKFRVQTFFICLRVLRRNQFSEASFRCLSAMVNNQCRNILTTVFCKKSVLRNFAKIAGKHKYQSLFFNKVAGRGFSWQVFSCEFNEISKKTSGGCFCQHTEAPFLAWKASIIIHLFLFGFTNST